MKYVTYTWKSLASLEKYCGMDELSIWDSPHIVCVTSFTVQTQAMGLRNIQVQMQAMGLRNIQAQRQTMGLHSLVKNH